MEHVRRVRVLAFLAAAVAVAAGGLVRPALLRAGDAPWDPPPCPSGPGSGLASAPAWFSLDPDLDGEGSLAGQRLTLGLVGGAVVRRLDVPPESFASGPVGGRVLVGDDDGTRSRLRLVDVATGCATELGREATSVVRGAVLSPDGRIAWEHRVSRANRADLGIWRRPLAGGSARRVLPAMEPDARFGPTFSTELALTDDGRLTVTSCGELRCRIRVLDPRTGGVGRVDGTGPLVGATGDRLVAYAACHGFPCRLESIDLRTGGRTTLVADAGPASLGGPGGRTLVLEAGDGSLDALDLVTLDRTTVADAGEVPVRRGSGATSGAEVPPGTVLLAPGGHLTDPAGSRRLDVATGDVVPLAEVRP